MTMSASNYSPKPHVDSPYKLSALVLDLFAHPLTLKISAPVAITLSTVILFFIYPNVDSKFGFSVIQLQLSFDITTAQHIITSWGGRGVFFYVKWLFTGYLLAIAYWLMLTALLIKATRIDGKKQHIMVLLLPTIAAALDIIENTLHLSFLSNQLTSELNFQILCLTSLAKWTTLGVILGYLVSPSISSTSSSGRSSA